MKEYKILLDHGSRVESLENNMNAHAQEDFICLFFQASDKYMFALMEREAPKARSAISGKLDVSDSRDDFR